MSSQLAKQLRNVQGNPSRPAASVLKGRLQLLQSARGLGLEMVGLDGLAEVLKRVTAAGLDELDRLTAGQSGHGGSAES